MNNHFQIKFFLFEGMIRLLNCCCYSWNTICVTLLAAVLLGFFISDNLKILGMDERVKLENQREKEMSCRKLLCNVIDRKGNSGSGRILQRITDYVHVTAVFPENHR